MEKIKIFMNLISDSRIRLNDLGGHSYGNLSQKFSRKVKPEKTMKVPRSFHKKSSRYFNKIKNRVLYELLVPRSIIIKGANLKNA